MVNCFIVLIKVVLYQSNVNAILNLKIMRVLAHAKINFPSKLINHYINFYKLMYLLVKKTGDCEFNISNKKFSKWKK